MILYFYDNMRYKPDIVMPVVEIYRSTDSYWSTILVSVMYTHLLVFKQFNYILYVNKLAT